MVFLYPFGLNCSNVIVFLLQQLYFFFLAQCFHKYHKCQPKLQKVAPHCIKLFCFHHISCTLNMTEILFIPSGASSCCKDESYLQCPALLLWKWVLQRWCLAFSHWTKDCRPSYQEVKIKGNSLLSDQNPRPSFALTIGCSYLCWWCKHYCSI